MTLFARNTLLLSSTASLLLGLGGTAMSQTATSPEGGTTNLPGITVVRPERAQPTRRPKTRVTTGVRREPSQPPPPTAEQIQTEANRQVVQQTQNFDQRRDNVILPKTGASTYELTQRDIENIPQANAIQLSDLALQFPGVYQDSTSQGDFHIRNEHGNVQYRINGILLPDGVSGFSQILETSFISNMQLLTGALPAQYGLHTSGVIDITSKSGAA